VIVMSKPSYPTATGKTGVFPPGSLVSGQPCTEYLFPNGYAFMVLSGSSLEVEIESGVWPGYATAKFEES